MYNDCLFEIREAQDFGYTYAQSNVTKPPMGKVLCVSPWNIPLGIMLGQVMAALAAGNAVIATSAEQTSGTAALAVQLLHQAGVPKDVLQLVLGDVNIKQSMVSNPALDAILFTGSLQSARAIQRSIVRPIPVYAETSAIANAMIIDASINLLSRMPDIVKSAFGSSGQLCSSAAFIFVDEAIYDMFIENFIGHLNTKQIGDPLNPSTFIGPLNNDNHLKNIQKLVQEEIDT